MTRDTETKVLRRLSYGIYGLTSRKENDVNAMVITWITQISFDPRLLGIVIQKTAHSFKLIIESGVFVINIFNREDAELIKPIAKSRVKNPEKMKGIKFNSSPKVGCPILDGAAGYLECKVVDVLDFGGDHNLVIGEILNGDELKVGEASDTLLVSDLGWNYAG